MSNEIEANDLNEKTEVEITYFVNEKTLFFQDFVIKACVVDGSYFMMKWILWILICVILYEILKWVFVFIVMLLRVARKDIEKWRWF